MVSVDELLFGICDRDITNVGSTLKYTSRVEKEKTAGGRRRRRRRTTPNTNDSQSGKTYLGGGL